MKTNTKKGLILIGFGIIGITIIYFIINYFFNLIGFWQIGYYLGIILSIARLGFILIGILQIFGKFNIDKYFDMNKYFKMENNEIDETVFNNANIKSKISKINTDFETEIKKNINQLNLNKMEYKIEQVGAEFSNKAIKGLENRFNTYADQGFKFHSVFQVQKPGCLGIGSPSITYLAVYTKE